MKKPLISLIISNYNGKKYLKTCLYSVLKSSYKNLEVIIIDDGSTDNSLEILQEFKSENTSIIILKNSENLGAAASRNIASKKAIGEILIFLDNDTEVRKDWIQELIKPILSNKDIGASQSILLDFKKRELIQMAGGLLIKQTGWLIPFHQWEKYKQNRLKERYIVGISAALAVRKDLFEKIFGFDEREAIYTEDLDLCWRIWIAGYKIVLTPKSVVYHWTKSVESRGGMKASYRQIYFHLAKNSFRSIIKNYEWISVLKYLPVSIFINVCRGFLFVLSKKKLDALIGSFNALIWLILNFFDTLRERGFVQKNRKYQDKYLIGRIFTSESLYRLYYEYFRK